MEWTTRGQTCGPQNSVTTVDHFFTLRSPFLYSNLFPFDFGGSLPARVGGGCPRISLLWPPMVATGVLVSGGGGSWCLCASWTTN
uniref:DUF3778 domain-containing protein n=1 Tax=Oryza meridionalis TaxID=40149 RepID=A0A0E0F157_9ORYZ